MKEIKIKDGYFKIRPAGRHIITIGRDLIKDKYAAIVELVKNSFDADSPYCMVSLLPFIKTVEEDGVETKRKGIRIEVKDEGHGMSYDTVIDKWMVPSTNDKLIRKISPDGRLMQGRKGVGRYAASMLGDDIVLQTIDKKGSLTILYLIWNDFEEAKYLEDVNVLIENFKTEEKSGTEIIVIGDETHLNSWTEKQIQNLKFELKKLIPPSSNNSDSQRKFRISLRLGAFPQNGQLTFDSNAITTEDIEPYPLVELYDYKISGTISNDGIAKLAFQNNRIGNTPETLKEFRVVLNQNKRKKNEEDYCGNISVDFRVFDRDSASIDGLIGRGLKDPVTEQYVGRKEARLILDSFNGIGVYRNGFRLRPLGDPGYDWLELDKERVQNPSVKIGSDQVMGFIHIEPEEDSKLEEKSGRDGLKETPQYFGLQEICKQVLMQLEQRRFIYRKGIGLGRNNRNLEEKINTLYDFSPLKEKIGLELEAFGIERSQKEKISKIISDQEKEKNKVAEDLKQSIALYQGQATIGNIVDIILHEGRQPLNYFSNQIPLIRKWIKLLKEKYSQELFDKIIDRITVIEEQTIIFKRLFGKLDPLSSKNRPPKKDFNVRNVIETIKDVFQKEFKSQEINYKVDCDIFQMCYGWKEDFYIAFTNLVDNSIYWLNTLHSTKKEISFKVYTEDNFLVIEYHDNGPGIEKNLIESQIIFEPQYSNKTGGGMGLGLPIAGEAIMRNNGELKAIYSESGAFFKIIINTSLNEK